MTMSKTSRAAMAALLCALPLAACAPTPPLGAAPAVRAPDSFKADASFGQSPANGTWPQSAWWRAYGDAQLDALMAEGLRGAPDMAAAQARLKAAEAYRQQANAARLPTLDGNVSAGAMRESYNEGIPPAFVPHGVHSTGTANLSLDFDLDLWGKAKAALRAARADELAARLDVDQARLTLSTNIANAYADLARLYAERDVAVDTIAERGATRDLVARRYTTGLDTRAELKQADAAVPAARADLAEIDEQIGLTRNRLAALLGAGPDRGLAITRPVAMVAPRGIPRDASTNLMGQRPDVAAARARVEAAAQQIKVARADFYPAISLSALAGYESLGLSQLIKGSSSYGNVGPAVSLPIFHGGRIAGAYRQARASYDEAVADYDNSVVTAFHDVADAATSQSMLTVRLDQSRQALADAQEAYAVARQRYEGGLSTYLTVLTAEDTMLQDRRTVADLQARAFTLDVALVRALGGGFAGADSPRS